MSSSSSPTSTLIFFVNGKKIVEPAADPEWTLLFYLRKKLKLCGTKLGCAEGGCGACTVMVSKYSRQQDSIVHLSVNACLAPVCSMHGLAVTTVEGIGSTKTRLHPVQEKIAKAHGSQCGFCTPGIVMSMYTLLRCMPKPTYEDLETAFQGNLCRCTGYRPIIEGYKTFTEEWERKQMLSANGTNKNGACSLGEKCCKNGGNGYLSDDEPQQTFDASSFKPYDPSQEPIFPPELKLNKVYDEERLFFKGKNVTWYRPTTMTELLKLKSEYNNAKLVIGNTEIGVEVKFKNMLYPVIIMPSSIDELNDISVIDNGLRVGAAVTLTNMENKMKELINTLPDNKTKIFKAIVDMLYWFAGKQIRNVAAVGGNIMTGSPISDLNPIFLAAGVVLNLKSSSGERQLVMDHTFFTSYRKNVVKPDEILVSIEVPYTKENQYFKAFKQAKRREDDIAIVNMALSVYFQPKTAVISDIKMSFGGMAPVTVLATKTAQLLNGQRWDDAMVQKTFDYLLDELLLSPEAPGGMIQYRRSLTCSLFFKAYLEIAEELAQISPNLTVISDVDKSGIGGLKRPPQKSSQYFNMPSETQPEIDPVGRPMVHVSGIKHATGEAVYCDDMPCLEGELYLAFVLSTKAHAKILSIDASEALSMPGVERFLSAKDIDPKRNHIGAIFHDEEVFISKVVEGQGQVLGAILSEDQLTAQRAAKAVKVTYEELTPVIVTIEDAIKYNSYYPGFPKKIQRGDVEEGFKNADVVVEGSTRVGGQEHFYLETHAARAVPKEDNELEIFSSSQHPAEISKLVSHVLDIPINRVVTKVKRMGGGFGGKESRGIVTAIPVAVAAHLTRRPVRCMLERDEDMLITGARHPFLFRYKIGAMKNGDIVAARICMYNNAGYSHDLSTAVLERAMHHCENSYYIPNLEIIGYVCKTNMPSNTAFRGFGAPQAMLGAESYIRDVANKLGLRPEEVGRRNLYREGQSTHYNFLMSNCTLERCWDEVVVKANYAERQKQVEDFNRKNRWKKRGISLVPTKFGIAFSIKFLNQAGALVLVYTDGSVLLTHGGTEMGQGLHTKMIQVASRALKIDASKIYISETATDKVPNTSPTAASVSSDINGMAVLQACETILKRLEPIRKANPTGKWEDWVAKAYLECISLSAVGYFTTPGIGYNLDKNEGTPFNYNTYGAACSEVEIDCLTGDHQVLRTDIVMDVGNSLNPAIDIGQIEGAFIQGYGLYTMEELIFSPTGTLYSRGPGAYKIPGFADIPAEFNVSLLKGAPNPKAVYSSKAVGEPPLFLASSVFFAIKEAIISARRDKGVQPYFSLDSPATAAKIRMACEDHITNKLQEPKEGTFTPWNVVP